MASTTIGPHPRIVHPKVTRIKTPVVSPEELLRECEPPGPVMVEAALNIAEITLAEHLRQGLEGFPYREQLAHPRAVWARVNAVALAHVRSAIAGRKNLADDIRRLLDTVCQGEQSC